MNERSVERGEDAPVEEVTRRPGERRNTGRAGPRRSDDEDPEVEAERLAQVEADVDERAAARKGALAGRPGRSRGSRRRTDDGTEIR